MSKVSPFLWFDTQAEEAVEFYVRVIPNSRIADVVRWGEAGPGPAGSVMTIAFELDGRPFVALNGGPQYRFGEAVSFVVSCDDQAEVDRIWSALTEGGQPGPCGWLKDRYGLSWQVVPAAAIPLFKEPDPVKAKRVFDAMMTMGKLDLATLQQAHEG